MYKGKTAGELCLKAASDSTRYDTLEVSHHLTNDIAQELATCAMNHHHIFDEDEYCVGYVIAGDPLLKNVMRRKFFAMLYMPSPRPNQCIFLYNKRWERFTKRLWTLPNANTMAVLSEKSYAEIDKPFHDMKRWSDWFYKPGFWQHIRDEHKISLLSEKEYLKANREKLAEAGCQYLSPSAPDTFDFAKGAADKIINPKITSIDENRFDSLRKTQDFNGSICTHKT